MTEAVEEDGIASSEIHDPGSRPVGKRVAGYVTTLHNSASYINM